MSYFAEPGIDLLPDTRLRFGMRRAVVLGVIPAFSSY